MLKKPPVAIILCLLIVLLSTVVSVHARLDANCAVVSDAFRAGDGIYEQLNAVCDSARGLIQLADSHKLDSLEASACAEQLQSALDRESPSKLYPRYQRLSAALSDLTLSLRRTELSSADQAALSLLTDGLDSARQKIADSPYNSSVNLYLHKQLGGFSCFIARLCGVRLPERFA